MELITTLKLMDTNIALGLMMTLMFVKYGMSVILMEKRLYNYIMRPAMLLTWAFGLVLIYLIGFDVFSNLWMQIKIVLIVFLSIYHEYLGKCLLALKDGTNLKSSKFFRFINEIPTVILIIVVFLAIFKPI